MSTQARGVGFGLSPFFSFSFGILVSCAAAVSVGAQPSPGGYAAHLESVDNPVDPSWQIGGFANGGFPPYYAVHPPLFHYQEELLFYSAGLEAGRMVTAKHGSSFLRGRGEAMVEVIPYWQVNHPAQTVAIYLPGSSAPSFNGVLNAYSIHGASITPLQFRWNFLKKDVSRFLPWVQSGLGLLWTNQEFPQGYGTALQPPFAKTSHINFTPQVDFGENIFVRRNQSVSLGVQAIHVTDFGLTTYDPGVNVVVEFRAGYSWWR